MYQIKNTHPHGYKTTTITHTKKKTGHSPWVRRQYTKRELRQAEDGLDG